MASEFVGNSTALSEAGLAEATRRLAVGAAEIWAVLDVETSGCGFLPDRRPLILFERHVFWRLTGGRFGISDVSNPDPGGYGAGGAHQYDRLQNAMALDRTAALQSASWGLPQIMGENAALVGFGDIESMVESMCDSEDDQLAAFVEFLQANDLDRFLQAHQWKPFAKVYNGPDFAKNQYDIKLAAAFAKNSAGPLPDLDVRAAQLYLTYAGFQPGPVDGIMGNKTRNALTAFQKQQGLPVTGAADSATMAALMSVALGWKREAESA